MLPRPVEDFATSQSNRSPVPPRALSLCASSRIRSAPYPSNVSRETASRSEEHTSELQSRQYLVCRLLLEKKKKKAPASVGYTPSVSLASSSAQISAASRRETRRLMLDLASPRHAEARMKQHCSTLATNSR